jgi:hypothetical protein
VSRRPRELAVGGAGGCLREGGVRSQEGAVGGSEQPIWLEREHGGRMASTQGREGERT